MPQRHSQLLARVFRVVLIFLLLGPSLAYAWGPGGHKRIGAIADTLVRGTHASREVASILSGLSLASASVWADCVRGVDPLNGFRYETSRKHFECKVFETGTGIAAMRDFVRRNHDNCKRTSATESCHKRYHFTDVSISRSHYDPHFTGARADDVVGATKAALLVLRGQVAPAPFNIKSRREALLLLAHYVGDLHQPLHVGAVYLNRSRAPVDPQAVPAALSTRGGNQLLIPLREENLHRLWDDLAQQIYFRGGYKRLMGQARQIPDTEGPFMHWPERWADDSLAAARTAYAGVSYRPAPDERWYASLPDGYLERRAQMQEIQLAKAGAHLAAILQALWP